MDMALCFVVFNPSQSKRLVMNALYVKNLYERQGLPVFFLELVYKGREPEINNAFHVSGDSILFHKENLYRVLETKIPRHYTKLAFLDADVFFSDTSWYGKASAMLDTHDIVQPYEEAVWLDITYRNELLRRITVVKSGDKFDDSFHPGFAWCMRRDWYKRIGFIEYAITGGGDTISSAAWMRKPIHICFLVAPVCLRETIEAYYKYEVPRISYIKDIQLFHLYHGSRANRNYFHRHKKLQGVDTISEIVLANSEGVLEWVDKDKWNPLFLEYFKQREDDGI
jgi:hypothetical protein